MRTCEKCGSEVLLDGKAPTRITTQDRLRAKVQAAPKFVEDCIANGVSTLSAGEVASALRKFLEEP